MAQRRNRKGGGVLAAFLVGGVLGALAALLFAPQRGRKLRADITERATNLVQDGERAMKSVASTVTSAAKEVERKTERILSR